MRVRLKDIADEVGVKPSTVSLVLNNQPKALTFSPETRRKIKEVAERLGYIPNAAARALVTRRTYNIGFIIPEYASRRWSNQFYSDMLNGVDEACYKHHYNLYARCHDLNDIADFVFPRGIAERDVDGLIISNAISPEILKKFEGLNIPCVRVGTPANIPDSPIPEFAPDLVGGYAQALEYLSRIGHRNVAYFNSGSVHSRYLADELSRYLSVSALADNMTLTRALTRDERCDEFSALDFMTFYFSLAASERPTAVITNPQTCLGILRELPKYNLNCPSELSVISNYDYNLFDYVSPGITALSYDNAAIASHAAETLLKMIDAKDRGETCPSKNDFPINLVIRQSCSSVSRPN